MNNSNIDNSISYRDIIDKYGQYIATPIGISMMPLIRERVDTVLLKKPLERCKKYDVILYQRKNGVHVLHRIIRVRKKSYDLCGDNQANVEHGVNDEMIIGVMNGIYRGEEFIPIDDLKYINYSKKIVKGRKWRYIKYFFKRVKNKIKGK